MQIDLVIQDSYQDLFGNEGWMCKSCKTYNPDGIIICKICNTRMELEDHKPNTITVTTDIEFIKCRWCLTETTILQEVCLNCDKSVLESRLVTTAENQIDKEQCEMEMESLLPINLFESLAEKMNEKADIKGCLQRVINPQKQIRDEQEIEDGMMDIKDLFREETVVKVKEIKKVEKEITQEISIKKKEEKIESLNDELLIGQGYFDDVKESTLIEKIEEEVEGGFGIDLLYKQEPIKTSKEVRKNLKKSPIQKEKPKHVEETFPKMQEKCLYCNDPFYHQEFEEHIHKCHDHEYYYRQITIFGSLSTVQVKCIKSIHEKSHKEHFDAKLLLLQRLKKMGYKVQDMDELYDYIHTRVPLIVHIHISKHMQFFVKDTHYRNQFETGKSSGSTNLVSRKSWQTRMFMSKYDSSPDYQRVKYGTINFTNDPRGVNACRGYGNSYLVLKKTVRNRCTLTDQDSSNASTLIGTFRFFYHVLNKLSDAELKATIKASKGEEVCSNVVSTYKQIQIHGPIDFVTDIEKVYVNEIEYKTPQHKALVEQFSKNFSIPYQVFK